MVGGDSHRVAHPGWALVLGVAPGLLCLMVQPGIIAFRLARCTTSRNAAAAGFAGAFLVGVFGLIAGLLALDRPAAAAGLLALPLSPWLLLAAVRRAWNRMKLDLVDEVGRPPE